MHLYVICIALYCTIFSHFASLVMKTEMKNCFELPAKRQKKKKNPKQVHLGSFCNLNSHAQYLSVDPLGAIFRLLHSSIEVNGQHVLRTRFLPRVSMPQPIVRLLHLQQARPGPKIKSFQRDSRVIEQDAKILSDTDSSQRKIFPAAINHTRQIHDQIKSSRIHLECRFIHPSEKTLGLNPVQCSEVHVYTEGLNCKQAHRFKRAKAFSLGISYHQIRLFDTAHRQELSPLWCRCREAGRAQAKGLAMISLRCILT